MITLSSIFCGFDSIRLSGTAAYGGTGNDDYYRASILLVYALFFDMLDGRVARLTKTQSAFGLQIDSLADVISFGVAPAALGFAAGLQGLWDWLVLGYFVCCGVSRLARFNITAEQLAEGSDKVKHFEGTPIPTSLALVVMLVVAADAGRIGDDFWFGAYLFGPWVIHPLVFAYALSGSLMVSKTIRIPKW